jgi:hypothetical protein
MMRRDAYVPGGDRGRLDEATKHRIIKLLSTGLSAAVIAQRFSLNAKTVRAVRKSADVAKST